MRVQLVPCLDRLLNELRVFPRSSVRFVPFALPNKRGFRVVFGGFCLKVSFPGCSICFLKCLLMIFGFGDEKVQRFFLVAWPFSFVTCGRTHNFIFAMFSSKWVIIPFQIISSYLMILSHPLFASLVPSILQLSPSTDQTEDRSTGLREPWPSMSGPLLSVKGGNGSC